MSTSQNHAQDEQPLGEEALAILAKARRRAAISMLVMLLGFMAIAIVVVYRLSMMGSGAESRYGAEAVAVPAGAEVISSQVGEGMVSVTYVIDGGTAIRVFDGRSGALISEIAVVGE